MNWLQFLNVPAVVELFTIAELLFRYSSLYRVMLCYEDDCYVVLCDLMLSYAMYRGITVLLGHVVLCVVMLWCVKLCTAFIRFVVCYEDMVCCGMFGMNIWCFVLWWNCAVLCCFTFFLCCVILWYGGSMVDLSKVCPVQSIARSNCDPRIPWGTQSGSCDGGWGSRLALAARVAVVFCGAQLHTQNY